MALTTQNPQALAQQMVSEFETSFTQKAVEEIDILDALQEHYNTLETNQRLYINYLSEFIEKLKTSQLQDKESLAQLKKQVLKHVLQSEKKSE